MLILDFKVEGIIILVRTPPWFHWLFVSIHQHRDFTGKGAILQVCQVIDAVLDIRFKEGGVPI